jgi:hypothetical protein
MKKLLRRFNNLWVKIPEQKNKSLLETLCFDFPVVEVEKAFIPMNVSLAPTCGFQGT